jgi:hypothetical protein
VEQTINGRTAVARYCASCGAPAGHGAAYCASCGTALVAEPQPRQVVVARPSPAADRRRVDRRTLLVAAALLVVVALIAALVLLRGGSDGPAFDHERAVADAGRAVVVTADAIGEAETVAALTAAAKDAGEQAEDLDAPLADADRIGDDGDRRATRLTLGASQAVLAGYAALADLAPERLDDWPALRADLSDAGGELIAADRELRAEDLRGLGAGVLDSTAETVDNVNELIEGAQAELRDWRAEADRINAERTLQLAALGGYEQAFRGHDARYVELRGDLQDFVDRVDADGVSFGEAYSTLSQATAQREEIRNALRALTPPPALAASHAGVVDVLDEAIDAMRSASEGVRQYEYSWDYWYYKDTPGWQTFMAASSGITGAHDTAFRAWEGAVAAERSRVEAIAPPAAPAV